MSESYIGQLDTTTPPGTAFISNADEVMRTIKTACKQSFPSVTGAVTLTHTQINALPGDITASQTALKNVLDPHAYTTIAGPAAATVVPKGTIVMWAPNAGAVPSGWRLCDGGTYNGLTVPDLRDRFVKCETTGFAGTRTVAESLGSSGSHTHTVGGTALTEAQMPAHTHAVFSTPNYGTARSLQQTGETTALAGDANNAGSSTYIESTGNGNQILQDTGSGDTHTHTLTSDGSHTHTGIVPTHYILAFICYVGA